MKIDIDVENEKHFKDIATLIDRPNFIKAVETLRKKWKLSKRYKPSEYMKFYSYIWGKDKTGKRWSDFQDDIQNLRSRFNRTLNYDQVILYAVAFTSIPEGAYKSCYIEAIPLNPSGEGPEDYKFHIVFSPETTRDEMLNEFRLFKNGQANKKIDDPPKGYEYEPLLFPTEKIKDNKSGNIKRDRKWYLLKQEGWSYNEILAHADKENTSTLDRDGIVKAIKAYEKRLK